MTILSSYNSMNIFVRSKLGNPWTDLPQILIGELGRPTGMFLAWVKRF